MLPIETISAEELDLYVGRKDAVLIDLREPEEYAKNHIRTAVNIPYEKLQDCRRYSRKKYWYSIVNGAAAACLQQENSRKWDIRQNPWWEESDVIKVRTCFFPQSIVE